MARALRHHLCAPAGGHEPCALLFCLESMPSEAIWAILGAHLLHLLLLGDFGYYYVKAMTQQGLDFKIELPMADMV